MSVTKKISLCVAPVLLAMLAGGAQGQQFPDNGNQPPRQMRQGGGPGGPGGMRDRMMADLKRELGVTDAEFKAIQPKIEQVMRLQRESNSGRPMFGPPGRGPGGPGGPGGGPDMGPGGPGGPGGPPPQGDRQPSLIEQTTSDLQMTIDNTDASSEDIKAGLDALRQAKAKAKEDLVKAQTDLKQALTARQEAVLVTMGMLD